MIMPFLRLVIIYIVVILAALLVFKRDQVMSLMGLPWGGDNSEIAAPAPAEITEPAVNAEADAPKADTAVAPQTEAATGQPPKYPTEDTAQIATPTGPSQTAPPQTAPSQTTPAPTATDDIQTRLTEARQTYWNRDLAGAEVLYKSLVADAPTNADIKGELGNLYFAQRRMNEAADMYHQTGLQLIADGNTRQIMSLVGVLQNIAPDKAADLRNRLSK